MPFKRLDRSQVPALIRSCHPIHTAESAPQPEPADTGVLAPDRALDVNGQPRPLVTRKQQRHAAIQQLRAQGQSLTAISRQLGVCFRIVQRYPAANLDDLLAPASHRSSMLDDYADYIPQRRAQGLTDATVLHAELQTAAGAAAYAPCSSACDHYARRPPRPGRRRRRNRAGSPAGS
ncbi:helix-turn-helix domain-containing protein [Micromonosporaceae bacterium Da 78-11]